MAKKQTAPKSATGVALVQGLAKVFTSIIETFGWPGGILFLGYTFVFQSATADQKQRIIEMYVLGNDTKRAWPIAVICVVSLCTVLAQKRWYDRKLDKLSKEMERVGNEKSLLQQLLTGQELQHVKPETISGRK